MTTRIKKFATINERRTLKNEGSYARELTIEATTANPTVAIEVAYRSGNVSSQRITINRADLPKLIDALTEVHNELMRVDELFREEEAMLADARMKQTLPPLEKELGGCIAR